MDPLLGVVIVTYNSQPLLDECLSSIRADELGREAPVVLVDNASSDGGPAQAAARWGARVVAMGRNAGFGAANNVGIGDVAAAYVLMANPDTRLHSGALAELVAFMDEHPSVGLVGPKLVSPDGGLQLSIRNYPTVLREAFECLFLHRAFPNAATRLAESVWDAREYERRRPADWVGGPVMLARTEALEQIGGFDEGFFLYSEEIDLCRRLTRAGWEVWYSPDVVFEHVGGEFDANSFLAIENQRSKLRYFLKHEGRLRMLLFSLVVAARLTIRAAVWAVPAVLRREGTWRKRLSAAVSTLVHYPRLVAGFLRSPVPVTVPMSRIEEGAV